MTNISVHEYQCVNNVMVARSHNRINGVVFARRMNFFHLAYHLKSIRWRFITRYASDDTWYFARITTVRRCNCHPIALQSTFAVLYSARIVHYFAVFYLTDLTLPRAALTKPNQILFKYKKTEKKYLSTPYRFSLSLYTAHDE